MQPEEHTVTHTINRYRSFRYELILEGVVVGALAGAVVVAFRYLIGSADILLNMILDYGKSHTWFVPVWILILAVAACVVSLLLKWDSLISGSGIPQIEGEIIGNIAGGTSSPDFGAPINWAVGVFVVLVVLGFNVFGKGLPKVAAILIGMTAGYILSVILGLVSFSGIGEAAWFAVPKPFAFGVKFDLGYILMFVLLYFIVAVQMIGDFNVSCMGGLDREPTPDEIGGGATANGITSIISAVLNSFPTATYSQNSGIVALTKVCSRFVILVGCGILFLAGLCPKVGAVLSTIPNCVIGGGTVVVFAMIATSGMKLLAKAGYSNRNCLIIGVSLAFGLGTQFCKGASAQFPAGIAAMLEENSVILTSLLAIILNLVFPKDPVVAAEKVGKAQ